MENRELIDNVIQDSDYIIIRSLKKPKTPIYSFDENGNKVKGFITPLQNKIEDILFDGFFKKK